MHVPVLADEVIDWLQVREEGTYVDCTVGLGGHSSLIAARLESGRLLGMDRDARAMELARERLSEYPGVTVVHRNYREITAVLEELGMRKVDGILLDAGISSMQLDDPDRGFSFQQAGPLDMRMDGSAEQTARSYLHHVSEPELTHTLQQLGDVRPARRIAKAIIRRRDGGRLETTADLADAVREGLPFVQGDPDEIRTVFQAIRMAVNDELGGLESAVKQGIELLVSGGRFAVISFHSGEDRVVKRAFRNASRPLRELHPDGRVAKVTPPRLKVLTSKPVRPGEAEVRANPRAASARLRVAERLPEESVA
jgi:16S rRNA (cytosine1402-N4)-methyltransferase